jgi:hypothetical protein
MINSAGEMCHPKSNKDAHTDPVFATVCGKNTPDASTEACATIPGWLMIRRRSNT